MSQWHRSSPTPTRRPTSQHVGEIAVAISCAVVIVVVIGCLALIAGMDDDETGTAPVTQPTESATGGTPTELASPSQTPGIGDPVTDGIFAFTVTGIDTRQRLKELPPRGFIKATGKYVIVNLTARNTTDTTRVFAPVSPLCFAYDEAGHEFKTTVDGIPAVGPRDSEAVHAGSAAKFWVVFEVPEDVTLVRVNLRSQTIISGVDVRLRQGQPTQRRSLHLAA